MVYYLCIAKQVFAMVACRITYVTTTGYNYILSSFTMNKRKIFLLALTLIMSACFLFTLLGCSENADCAHEWQNTSVRTEPTCTVDGNQQQVCIKCGNFQTITLTSLGHDTATTWTVDETEHWHLCNRPNCTEKADVALHVDTDKNHKCDVCDANVGKHVAAEGTHVCDYCQQSMGEHVGGTATCTSQAICTICSEPYGTLTNHNLDATGKCTNKGCNYVCTAGLVFKDIDETTTSVVGLVSDAQDIVIPQTYNGKRLPLSKEKHSTAEIFSRYPFHPPLQPSVNKRLAIAICWKRYTLPISNRG